jgi:hypothetical protein
MAGLTRRGVIGGALAAAGLAGSGARAQDRSLAKALREALGRPDAPPAMAGLLIGAAGVAEVAVAGWRQAGPRP